MIEIENWKIIVGSISIFIIIIVRIAKLKSQFMRRIHLITTLGYCIFAYLSGVVAFQMFYLAVLTYYNSLTLDIIVQNKVYIFLAWVLFGLASLIAYLSLVTEEKS